MNHEADKPSTWKYKYKTGKFGGIDSDVYHPFLLKLHQRWNIFINTIKGFAPLYKIFLFDVILFYFQLLKQLQTRKVN